jgi:hypothetical protein
MKKIQQYLCRIAGNSADRLKYDMPKGISGYGSVRRRVPIA